MISLFIFAFFFIVDTTPLTKPTALSLSNLQRFTVSGIFSLFNFVEAAPNLHNLDINFKYIKDLLNDEQTCHLLQQRITRLDVYEWDELDLDVLKRISQVFINLRQLIIAFSDSTKIVDSLVLSALDYWNGRELQWIFASGALSDEARQNPQQWFLEHAPTLQNSPFSAQHNDRWLTLWK